MKLEKYSFGMGDRFAHQGKAQLSAVLEAKNAGVTITPVWNKSYREHKTIGSSPDDVRREADAAVQALGWEGQYFVDADHINMKTVDGFIAASDFFTLDVADYIGRAASADEIDLFVDKYSKFAGKLNIPGIPEPFQIDKEFIENVARNFLFAILEAGLIYRHIANKKSHHHFVVEVSMDEVEEPQTPEVLFFILAALADEGIPAQTIAPKFTGRFNKGVDYVGDIDRFAREFENDLLVIRHAVDMFGLPENLKLSVHSGSDKFSIYGPIHELIVKYDAGLHLKTAGTTWLEELAGLALAEGKGLDLARKIYRDALGRFEELTDPYKTVIDVHRDQLPSPDEVDKWTGKRFAATLKHDQNNPDFDPQFRQLLHCAYKVAAELGDEFTNALVEYEDVIGEQVRENLYERHIKPLFIGR